MLPAAVTDNSLDIALPTTSHDVLIPDSEANMGWSCPFTAATK
jgi:hypothetical protein